MRIGWGTQYSDFLEIYPKLTIKLTIRKGILGYKIYWFRGKACVQSINYIRLFWVSLHSLEMKSTSELQIFGLLQVNNDDVSILGVRLGDGKVFITEMGYQ